MKKSCRSKRSAGFLLAYSEGKLSLLALYPKQLPFGISVCGVGFQILGFDKTFALTVKLESTALVLYVS